MAEKPDDIWVVPLGAGPHRLNKDAQHAGNERSFWKRYRIDVVVVAAALFIHSGDDEIAERIIRHARFA